MRQRCGYSKHIEYKRYGAQGIKVCEKWMSFSGFFEDMGEKPAGMSLDRIDPSGDYCKENCRWATRIEQANNTKANRVLVAFGRSQTATQWSREIGISASAITRRIKRGWPIERALQP
jgi:hypothetical protein